MQPCNRTFVGSCFAASFALCACADEAAVEDTCVWVFSLSECKDQDGADEVGDGDGDLDDDPAPLPGDKDPPPDKDVCLTEANGHTKILHQCEGELSVSIAFDTFLGDCAETLGNAALCTEVHEFGPDHDSYEAPAVMACCDPFDAGDPISAAKEGSYLQNCAADAVEQICRSLPLRLQNYIDDGLLVVGKNQAQKLQSWLAKKESLQACYNALYGDSGVLGQLDAATWVVNGGNNADWSLLKNFRVELEYGDIEAVSLPDDPQDWLTCVDSNQNNTEIFEHRVPAPVGVVGATNLASSAKARIVGPELFGSEVSGTASLNSPGRSCRPWCSTMEIARDSASLRWTLTELELFADAPVVLGNASFNAQIERAALRLYASAEGSIIAEVTGQERYLLDAHAASFVVSGVSDDTCDLRWASNATPIVASQTATGWRLDGFEIEHVDAFGDRWTIHIPPTTWE